MKYQNPMSHLSGAAVLDALGLQSKPSAANRALTYAGFVVAGVAVGAVAALLLAPKSGRALRGDIQKGTREFTDQMSASAHQVVDSAQRKVSELRGQRADSTDAHHSAKV